MLKERVTDELIDLMSGLGVIGIDKDNYAEVCENDIRDYIADSLQFVSFIVNVEKHFKVDLPEAFLFADFSISLDVLIQYIIDKSNI